LKEILLTIEQKYQVPFYYKQSWIPDTTLSVGFDDEPIVDAVHRLIDGTNLAIAIFDQRVLIIAPAPQLSKEFSVNYFMNQARQNEYLRDENLPANLAIINLGKEEEGGNNEGFEISGRLTDELDGEQLAGASIYIRDLDLAASSDTNGRFSITLPSGLHLCEIRMVGYDEKVVGINILNSADWNISLLPEATELDEILVSARANDSNVRSTKVGLTKLTPLELKEMPVFMGEPDVIKSILTLPGISTVGEGASGFNVRGGNIDQNLIMQDNALIFNSSHALGFFSIFNPDATKEVTLYKGHIPAQYGGRVSSVLDVKLKSNNYETFKANGGIGLLASRLTIETPLIKDKTSILLGGRTAYSDWVLNFVDNPDIKSSGLSFHDVNAKISHKLGKKGTMFLSYYRSFDRFEYARDLGFEWDANTLSLQWDQVINPDIISEFTLSYSNSGNTSFQPSGIDGFNLKNGMDNYKLKEDILITSLKNHTVNVGFELNAYVPVDETIDPYSSSSTVIPESVSKDQGLEAAIYINDNFDISPTVSVSIGLRYSLYNQFGPATVYEYEGGAPDNSSSIIDSTVYESGESIVSYDGLDPRFSLRWITGPNSSIKMSYNQIVQYIHLISNTTAALPADFWQVCNTYFQPLRAHNYSLGYFRNFRLNQWETSVEAYYRDMNNLVEYKDFPDLYQNRHLETELLTAQGMSYGLEFYIKKKTGKFNGWLSYTYFQTFMRIDDESKGEQVNRGEWFPSKFDQTHNLSIVGNFNFNKTNQLSFNFSFATGRPLTVPNSNYSLDDYIVPNYSDRNEYRLPNIHRLDSSYTIQRGVFRTHKYKDSLTFSIYNLYARQNAYSIYFKRDRQNVFGAYKLSILGTMLPSLTYNFQF